MFDKGRIKRAFDVALALASAPIAVPVVGTLSLWVMLESPGNPFFLQKRVGKDGREFKLFKIRTMVPNAENIGAGLYNEKDDPRYTEAGKWARRFSLDEMPQLLNVLLGDMSLVGPRPQLRLITDQHPEFESILEVRPGLTGLSQVSGRNSLTRAQRIDLDIKYASGWSLFGDLQIILRTFGVVLTGEGQLNDQSQEDVER